MVEISAVEYKCGKCGRIIKVEPSDEEFRSGLTGLLPGVRCPECGYRILYKVRSPTVRRVKAI